MVDLKTLEPNSSALLSEAPLQKLYPGPSNNFGSASAELAEESNPLPFGHLAVHATRLKALKALLTVYEILSLLSLAGQFSLFIKKQRLL